VKIIATGRGEHLRSRTERSATPISAWPGRMSRCTAPWCATTLCRATPASWSPARKDNPAQRAGLEEGDLRRDPITSR